jgi:hypothetical protein
VARFGQRYPTMMPQAIVEIRALLAAGHAAPSERSRTVRAESTGHLQPIEERGYSAPEIGSARV